MIGALFRKGFVVVILIVVVAAVTIVGYSFKTGSSPVEVAKQVPRIIGGWIGVGTSLPGQVTSLAQKSAAPLGRTTFGKTTRMKVPFGDKLVPGGITLGELPFYAITIVVCLGVTLAVLRRWVWEKYNLDRKWNNFKNKTQGVVGDEPIVFLVRVGSALSLGYSSLKVAAKGDLVTAATIGLSSLVLFWGFFFLWGKVVSFFAPKARDVLRDVIAIVAVIGLIVVLASALPKALHSPYGIISPQSWGRYAPVATLAYAITGGFRAEGVLAAISAFIFWIAPKVPGIFERGPAEV